MKVVPANHFGWHNNVVNHSYGGNNVIADKLMYKVDEIYMFNTHLLLKSNLLSNLAKCEINVTI